MHYYQFNVADYRKDTIHLTHLEHGIYRQLLDEYYLNEEPIKTQSVIRRLRIITKDETEALNNVLNDFFEHDESLNLWIHKRANEEIDDYQRKAETARVNGRKGGRPKKPKKTQPVNLANPDQTQTKANHKPLTINHKPNTTTTAISAESEHSVWNWNPKEQILDQLIEQFKIPKKFVDEKLFPFKTYWSEREDMGGLYDAKFVSDIQRSWKKYKHEWLEDNEQKESFDAELAPVNEIIDLYHEHLPELPPVKKITAARRDAVRRLWFGGEGGLPAKDDWTNFFKYVHESGFLMGLSQPAPGRDRPFKADFDWIIDETNAVKICEGKFHG